jgi:hypothetical protein
MLEIEKQNNIYHDKITDSYKEIVSINPNDQNIEK